MAINRHHDPRAGDAMLELIRETQYGLIKPSQLKWLAEDGKHRLTLALVRCGGCRFLTAMQDVEHLTAIIAAEGRDYVRDVNLPA